MSGNPDINFDLLSYLREKPHRHQSADIRKLPRGAGELLQEALACQHLLDLAGVPYERGYRGNVDARTYLLVMEVFNLRDRLDRMSRWHSRESASGGMFGDFCTECGHRWPCDSYRLTQNILSEDEDDRVAAPLTWSLPLQPGPKVKAVRCQAGHARPNGVPCEGYLWLRWDDGWGDTVPCMPWEYIVTTHSPLTDATHEVVDSR